MSTIAYHELPVRPAHPRERHLHAVPLAAPSSPAAAPLRLTRRGRVVVFAAVALLLAVLSVVLGASVAATDDDAALATTTVQVQPGQTLWEIAAEANPRGDIRSTIDDIVRLNALPNASGLKMGTTLAVPVYED
ncbi:LysM domain-containing protein [Aeromicrobium camelliae]|uniref:LysM domain-containing protein n=1 Tax=Aeromicrobium camelliae TaxID=1538144 RepID=A0A3N6XYV3_9ACTN|nr:LysM domain-containing protein [Aeromicrobium camelliae]RQN02904.1 LysM domain-containing protein [Aeromicrobium camelliae]